MATIDPEQEKQRLAKFYSGQLDEELERVAREAYELSDPAREALRGELSRRGLDIKLGEKLPTDEIDLREMVTIRRFRDLPEALLAKGSLDSAGIECVLVNENLVRLDWFWSNMMGGVMLQVDPDDVEVANDILSQPIPDKFEAEGTGEYAQPQCPNCGSLDVSFQELNKPVAYVTAYLGVPVPVRRRAWRCHSCNVEWEDDAQPGGTESEA